MIKSSVLKSDSGGSVSSSLEDEDEASTASTAINTSTLASKNQQHREKYLISRMDHRNHHHQDDDEDEEVKTNPKYQPDQLIVDDDDDEEMNRDELYDNLNSSSMSPRVPTTSSSQQQQPIDENVNDLDFQMSANVRPFVALTSNMTQDNRFLGTVQNLSIIIIFSICNYICLIRGKIEKKLSLKGNSCICYNIRNYYDFIVIFRICFFSLIIKIFIVTVINI